MAIPNPFRRLKASTSTVDELSAELGRLDRVRLDAQNTLHDLGAKRPGLLIDGTDAALVAHDAKMAHARAALEQAEARIALIEPEWRAADERETAARDAAARAARHASAVKARAEGVKLLDAYERDAIALAGKIRRLMEIEREIDQANADRVDDDAPIGAVEAFNGTAGTRDHNPERDFWVTPQGGNLGPALPGQQPPVPGARLRTMKGFAAIPGVPGLSHRSLLDRVALPSVDPNASSHWSGRLAAGPRLSADAAAVLRYHGVSA
ncbi:hypothetical protein [Lichenibacterium ramalinae]|uniref:Uncharacterized protein n=1 Tax=Lichenibacterium ramalinae TaxID=2316527 RepID=A0A4Q2RJS9_9HYPH|nr:hypothetical protein [Lichenibacterium ramalinae]RYB07271.1 hypothetical protein D3272_04225 [Lichenibacterium ramalinae]